MITVRYTFWEIIRVPVSCEQIKKLKYVFEFKKLDIGNVANSFFLFRIPRIKEILGKKIENFNQSNINPFEIQF